jgi:thiazole tautomerase (transcriptional regulator TenI)
LRQTATFLSESGFFRLLCEVALLMAGKELHIISTGELTLAELVRIAAATHRFAAAFHLREKAWTARELMEGTRLLIAAGVPPQRIVVNDRADVAVAAGVRGAHLAWHSLDVREVKRLFPQLRVGKSVHDEAEAVQAEAEGADYVLFGHIFATASKPGLPARGLAALQSLASRVKVPVIAIGGVTPERVPAVLQAGAAGVAVMSGIMKAADPVSAAQAYHDVLHTGDLHERA